MQRFPFVVAAVLALAPASLEAQGRRGGRFPQPNTNDLQQPHLIRWQRTLDDALTVSAANGRPLLICVNTDGEPASDSFAGVIYRSPEFATLTKGFVPVIACPQHHNDGKDHDDQGQRIPCPRFGGVTCGEHVNIEPELYRRYFRRQRSAPRHLGVGVSGTTLFDLMLLNDLSRVDRELETYGKKDVHERRPLSLDEALASADAQDRLSLEQQYLESTPTKRRFILRSAQRAPAPHFDLIAMGLRDNNRRVQREAINLLAQTATKDAIGLFPRAFDVSESLGGHRALLAAVAPFAEEKGPARSIYRARSGLYDQSNIVEFDVWRAVLTDQGSEAAPTPAIAELDKLDERLNRLQIRKQQHPQDGSIWADIAETTKRYAQVRLADGKDPQFLIEDVKIAAQTAVAIDGPHQGPAQGLLAWTEYMLGDFESAANLAEQALPKLVKQAGSPLTAEVLALFADCRVRSIYRAWANYDYEAKWVADAHAAYRTLALHQAAQEEHFIKHIDWLSNLEAHAQSGSAIDLALERLPWSGEIQQRMRQHLLRTSGPQGLLDGIAQMPTPPGHEATMQWFAGYGALIAAEQFLEEDDAVVPARAAYAKSIDLFTKSSTKVASYADSADHFAALALAGQAKIALDSGNFKDAVEILCQAIERKASSTREKDGRGITPIATARLLLRKLEEPAHQALRRQLKECLDQHAITLD